MRRAFAVRWLVAAVLLTAVCVGWGLASPIPSGPDEPAQMVKMTAVVHGTLLGEPVPGRPATLRVEIPGKVLRLVRRGRCDYRVGLPATCPRIHRRVRPTARTSTYVGRYPPLYYAFTGLPLLLASSYDALQASRALSGLLVGVTLGLALAVSATWGRSAARLLALGFVVTPTVLYLGGVVNPSASEVAGAILLWSALTVLAFDRPDEPPGAVVAAAVAGAVLLCASRSLSTLFFALIVAAMVAARPAAARRLWRHRRIRRAAVGTLAWAWLCGLWVLAAKSYKVEAFPLHGRGPVYDLEQIVGSTRRLLAGVIAGFGSPNFAAPDPVLLVWVGGAVALGAAVFLVASRSDRWRLAGLTLGLGFVVPFAIVFSHVRVDGLAWEGRYSLPLVAGLPLLAVEAVTGGRRRPGSAALARSATAVCATIAAGHVAAFYWLLRRYTVGLHGTDANAFATDGPHWTPLVGAPLLFGLVTACYLAWALWLRRQVLRADRRPAEPEAPGAAVAEPPAGEAVVAPVP